MRHESYTPSVWQSQEGGRGAAIRKIHQDTAIKLSLALRPTKFEMIDFSEFPNLETVVFPGTFREGSSFASDGNFAQSNEVPLPYLCLISPSSKRQSLPNFGYSLPGEARNDFDEHKEPVDPRARYPSFRLITTAPTAKKTWTNPRPGKCMSCFREEGTLA